MDKNTQLYTLLKDLSLHITDTDDLGQIIGYSVLQSLMQFETTSGSPTEIEFQEIKAIYAGLEETITSCRQEDPYRVLCDLEVDVRQTLDQVISEMNQTKDDASSGSRLIKDIIITLKDGHRHYQDHVKRMGLSLKQSVSDKGEITGWKNILIADYKTVHDIFVYK